MSSNPFEAPPRETAATLPPNRTGLQGSRRTLAMWLVLVVLFVAIYQLFAIAPPHAEPPSGSLSEPTAPATPAELFLGPIAWALPALVYGAMIVALLGLRAKLPASHRTGELRTHVAPKPDEPPAAEPPAIALTLRGTDGQRSVRLEVDAAGLHWHADARLLHGAAELHVAWSELEAVSTSRAASGLAVWAWVASIVAATSLFSASLIAALVAAPVAAALFFASKKRSLGVFSFTTPTHTLTFQSRELDPATADRLVGAVRARKPGAAPQTAQNNSGVLRVLLLDPFVQLRDGLASRETLEALLTNQGTTLDAATRATSLIQSRMFSLWSGTMRGAGPASVGLAAALAQGSAYVLVVGWLPAWVLGLILVQVLLVPFARFAGLTVLR